MRAEEGDESINDYADEARQTQKKVGGSQASLWPRKLFGLLGLARGTRHGASGTD